MGWRMVSGSGGDAHPNSKGGLWATRDLTVARRSQLDTFDGRSRFSFVFGGATRQAYSSRKRVFVRGRARLTG